MEVAKPIKPINVDSVHKICSGQVVLSLAVAVKELVENALDAGAKNIEVRLKNYGIDLIEVSDNGTGVTEDNFTALTMKYHTSKLTDYSDLLDVSSFGFRGEALSSLCALADLTVTTRHINAELATKIEYDHKGNITTKTPCARQVGTTVSLSNLFSSLPVRQREFHKNAKREFNKMTQLLYAYCLISLGVKITCTNQTTSKSVVVATQGKLSYKDNIACIFGFKQLQSLLEIKPHYVPNIKENIFKGLSGEVQSSEDSVNLEDVEIDLSEDSNEADNTERLSQDSKCSQVSTKSQGYQNAICPIEFTGFISSCAHGSGRSSTDRQFFFVNSRPCDPPKVIKLINEIYRQYNPNQYPFVFININLDRTSVDVNVTPDKRKVFLTKEKVILDVIKSSLLKLYETIPRTLKIENSFNKVITKPYEELKPVVDQPRTFNSFLHRFSNNTNLAKANRSSHNENETSKKDLKRKSTTMLDFVSTKLKIRDKIEFEDEVMQEDIIESSQEYEDLVGSGKNEVKYKETEVLEVQNNKDQALSKLTTYDVQKQVVNFNTDFNESHDDNNGKEVMYLDSTDNLPATQIRNLEDVIIQKSYTYKCKSKNLVTNLSPVKKDTIVRPRKIMTDKEDLGKYNRKSVILKTSLEHVKALGDLYNKQKISNAPERVKFRSGINPIFNKNCEEELSKEISKDSFKQMVVIGQFNLGFIITKLNDDLFIIDQHATDEIYNFEMLQKMTELTNQKLVIPQQLELTGVNEQILMDNQEIFKKNGFTFEINEEALPTKRVKLLTIPLSKNWVFGKEDIEEMLFMLRESPSENIRPSRVRAMFASRACRKSVMIGTALATADMKNLVDHMSEIDKPWNCPHGRPTIRHLINLAMVQTND